MKHTASALAILLSLAAVSTADAATTYIFRYMGRGPASGVVTPPDEGGGNNPPAIMSGPQSGSVTEDGTTSASGGIIAADWDLDATLTWSITGGGSGTYGTLSIDHSGTWVYTLDPGAADPLAGGQSVSDTFTAVVSDEHGATASQTVTISITGANDPAVLVPVAVSRTEGNTPGAISASGTLTISDVDSPESFVAQPGTVGLYGTFTVDAAGGWTYTASSAHEEFEDGSLYTDAFTVAAADGTTTTVTINITGTDEGDEPTHLRIVAANGAVLECGLNPAVPLPPELMGSYSSMSITRSPTPPARLTVPSTIGASMIWSWPGDVTADAAGGTVTVNGGTDESPCLPGTATIVGAIGVGATSIDYADLVSE